jgi:hypothetical protein
MLSHKSWERIPDNFISKNITNMDEIIPTNAAKLERNHRV